MKKQLLLTLTLVGFLTGLLQAQQSKITIRGTVQTQNREAIQRAYVFLKNTGLYTKTNKNGDFSLTAPPGTYTLIATRVGFLKKSREISIQPSQKESFAIVLAKDPDMTLDNVVVMGKSVTQQINESAYNVAALDARTLQNTTMNVSQALDRISGVKIRKTGGLGSETSITLNGFSGRHVKVFIDGVPMRGYGPAFQISNIPVSIVNRLEVYKGVVPIQFGSDALGGVINIVTNNRANSYLDVSYSYGSFNSHKSYINAGYTSKSGFQVTVNAYQNYSDNNYDVDAKILNLDTNIFEERPQEVSRFHDTYHNEAIVAKAGVINKSFADKLLVGLTVGQVYDEIQHPADMAFVYGKRHRKASSLVPSLLYKKGDLLTKNMDLSVNAYFNFGDGTLIDTVGRRYNWLGQYIERSRRGELSYTHYNYESKNGAAKANLSYTFLDRHTITINNSLTSFSRSGHDQAEPSPTDGHPNKTIKNVLGIGYKLKFNERWNTSIFLKHYINTVESYLDPDGLNDYDTYTSTTNYTGYGIASTYFITDNFQIKASYEQTYRLPTGRELFGSNDGIIVGNFTLEPENSDNFNLGFGYNTLVDHSHYFNFSLNFIYRKTQDYIRRQIRVSTGTAGPINEGLVENKGLNAKLRYSYKNLFTLGGAFTYQDIRNKLKYRNNSTVVSTIYNDRVPNVPYLYSNAHLTFYFGDTFSRGDKLSIEYSLDYMYEFYYDWASYGGITIPTQFSHNFRATYSLLNGRYNLTLEARNITDENLYDNYSLQKPGRSFSLKLRYFIN